MTPPTNTTEPTDRLLQLPTYMQVIQRLNCLTAHTRWYTELFRGIAFELQGQCLTADKIRQVLATHNEAFRQRHATSQVPAERQPVPDETFIRYFIESLPPYVEPTPWCADEAT